ncbi:zonular occludens toxin domain-containing protein [Raoultibacter phocaeensis]|uniref:zonular occludens toxin domain-containing protein n=1 Tax=Raoultibacter phocaeensis TaxID=2479841 RepID=UPI001118444F|nr:zonular occludens toxin domain-containing protein [Raoultibacter phocaeensis]
MIYLFTGTPGSGKSLHQARDIRDALRRGRPVIANYAVNVDCIRGCKGEFVYMDNDDLTPAALIDYARNFWRTSGRRFRESTIKLYIDECQLLFNARTWHDKSRSEWVKFFTQHRKYGFDIYLVAQFDRMIDRQIRNLIEYEYNHRSLANFGTLGFLFSLLVGGRAFCGVKTWYQHTDRLGSVWLLPLRRYTRIYDTFNLFDDVPVSVNG